MTTPVTSPSPEAATSTPDSGDSEPPPFEFIKLPDSYHQGAAKDVQRLDYHIETTDMIHKFDEAIKTLSAKVSEKWATRNLPYLRVAVLLIRWEEDDLGVDEEIKELQDLLTRFFRYAVESWLIPKGTPKRVYIALMNKLHSFTEAHNTEDTLLWIYYGGHGRQDPRYPGPVWFPKRSGGTDSDTHVQSAHLLPILSDLDCDVLLLFDSCQAIPPNITSSGQGVVSVLSATGFDGGVAGIAPPVGPHSFTRALIDELASLLNHFVNSVDAQPTTDIALHGNLLVRLKLHLASVEKDTRGKIRCAQDGSVVFERVQRRTPFYRFLSKNKQPRPIYIAPLPAAPKHYSAGESPSRSRKGKHVLEEDSEEEQKNTADTTAPPYLAPSSPPTEEAVPKVLVRVLLCEGNFNTNDFAKWLLQAPKEARNIVIEGVYGSLSTLLVVKMPLLVWNLLSENQSMSLLGYITTDNKADVINENIKRSTHPRTARGTLSAGGGRGKQTRGSYTTPSGSPTTRAGGLGLTKKPSPTVSRGSIASRGRLNDGGGRSILTRGSSTTSRGSSTTARGSSTTAIGGATTARGSSTPARGSSDFVGGSSASTPTGRSPSSEEEDSPDRSEEYTDEATSLAIQMSRFSLFDMNMMAGPSSPCPPTFTSPPSYQVEDRPQGSREIPVYPTDWPPPPTISRADSTPLHGAHYRCEFCRVERHLDPDYFGSSKRRRFTVWFCHACGDGPHSVENVLACPNPQCPGS